VKQQCIVLEYVEGEALCNKKVESEVDVATIIGALVDVLQYCHMAGTTHRDLRLENIVVPEYRSYEKLKVMGFKENSDVITKGQQAFVAPEIVLNSASDSPKRDIWSVGVIAYLLLSGSLPDTNLSFDL